MTIFVAIALAAFLVVGGSFLFGSDHDHDHDHDHGHGDSGHDAGADSGDPTISIFSTKVVATLFMGFGAAGAIARYYERDYVVSSGIGLLSGVALAAIMYLMLGLFYSQQASSLVATHSAVGCAGTVTVPIEAGSLGEIGLSLGGEYRIFPARAQEGVALAKGQTVRVLRIVGTHVIVEPIT
ncbi:MAG TPA: NfeD family protein [Verrucomicrobiota bacterium]|nr:NfeD family protein [Verrucomicrobiota bacterium]HNU50702.1 NfeD family protein [Verrucomicrobiota bacterium]